MTSETPGINNICFVHTLVPCPTHKLGHALPPEVIEQVETTVKYSGYLGRQQDAIDRLKQLENKHIPLSLDYNSIIGLRTEARQKLAAIRPKTLGQASRIPGVSPADISLLSVWTARVGSK